MEERKKKEKKGEKGKKRTRQSTLKMKKIVKKMKGGNLKLGIWTRNLAKKKI